MVQENCPKGTAKFPRHRWEIVKEEVQVDGTMIRKMKCKKCGEISYVKD